jgi:glycosyltransferase involved in cell wall biosynthesis
MNILFLTLVNIDSIDDRNIYTDLLREFYKNGDKVYIVSPSERRLKKPTRLIEEGKSSILKVKILNNQKTNMIEKGISTLLLESQYLKAIKKYFPDISFDCVIYSTPPITFEKVISFIKKRDGAKSYLLLKDIFPQNAVDLDIFKENGVFHRYFRKKEEKLYQISDYIGCMSPANYKYLLTHNREIESCRVEVNPNSIALSEVEIYELDKDLIRKRHCIPTKVTTFIYGGNLGKPQGVEFLIEILKSNFHNANCFFVIVGSGTEYNKLEKWFNEFKPANAILLSSLPKEDYDRLVKSCDVGLIFLNRNFTIPNFPSRILSYMECKLPVIAATDINTDIGDIIEENKFGFWVESGKLKEFNKCLHILSGNKTLIREYGLAGYEYLKNNYTSTRSYQIIRNHLKN